MMEPYEEDQIRGAGRGHLLPGAPLPIEKAMFEFALAAARGIGPCDCDGCLSGEECEVDRLAKKQG